MAHPKITAILVEGKNFDEVHIEHPVAPVDVIILRHDDGTASRFRFHGERMPFDADTWIYEREDRGVGLW